MHMIVGLTNGTALARSGIAADMTYKPFQHPAVLDHDQGHVLFKAWVAHKGVSFEVGLPSGILLQC